MSARDRREQYQELAPEKALIAIRYPKVPLLADLSQEIVQALRCGELELATSRGLRIATGTVQRGALFCAKTGTES